MGCDPSVFAGVYETELIFYNEQSQDQCAPQPLMPRFKPMAGSRLSRTVQPQPALISRLTSILISVSNTATQQIMPVSRVTSA